MIVARVQKREKVGMAGIEVGDSVGRERAGQKKGDRGREAVGRRGESHEKQRSREAEKQGRNRRSEESGQTGSEKGMNDE